MTKMEVGETGEKITKERIKICLNHVQWTANALKCNQTGAGEMRCIDLQDKTWCRIAQSFSSGKEL